jgi:DNA-binding GntR family transcriptional regulator
MSLADEAYALLRGRVVRCELVPGERVTARGLAARLEVGITPVREALARLEHERLVATLPRRGYLVTPVTARGVRQTTQAWSLVAPPMAALAVAHASDLQARRIAGYLGRTDGDPPWSGADGRPPAERHSRGWRLVAQVGGNEVLGDLYRGLDGALVRQLTLLFDLPGRPSGAQPVDWREAFSRRDPEYAAAQVRRHAASLTHSIEQALRAPDAERWLGGAAVPGSRPSGRARPPGDSQIYQASKRTQVDQRSLRSEHEV